MAGTLYNSIEPWKGQTARKSGAQSYRARRFSSRAGSLVAEGSGQRMRAKDPLFGSEERVVFCPASRPRRLR